MRQAASLLLSCPPKPKRRAAMKAYLDLLDGKGDIDEADDDASLMRRPSCYVQKAITVDFESQRWTPEERRLYRWEPADAPTRERGAAMITASLSG